MYLTDRRRKLLAASIVFGALALALGAPRPARAEDDVDDDDAPSPWHLALDAGYGRARVGFFGPGSVIPEAAAEVGLTQPPPEREQDIVRVSASLGLAGLALEGGATFSLGTSPYVSWTAGVRLETSWQAPLSVAFRMAFVERTGDAPGRGGRAGIGLSIRPFLPIAVYADASAEATTVPDAMHDGGTYFAYALALTGGARVAFR